MWEVSVQHEGLKAYRVVRGVTQEEAELKANLQIAAWNERWARTLVALKAKQEKLQRSWDIDANKESARARTGELQKQIEALVSDRVNMDQPRAPSIRFFWRMGGKAQISRNEIKRSETRAVSEIV
jgi:hypothetical protein